MKETRLAKRLAAGIGFFFLCALPGLTRAQSLPPAPVQTPRRTSIPVRPKKAVGPTDDFAGLKFTDDQKAKISQIHQDIKMRMDAVAKSDKLSPEQKDAMLQGYQSMERSEVFKVLTPEQQAEVRKKILARRKEAQKEKQQTQPTQSQKPRQPQKPPQPPPA